MQFELTKEKVKGTSGVPTFLKVMERGMEITINNQVQHIDEHISLAELIQHLLGEKQNGIALALNQEVIPKNNWSETKLKAHDELVIIKATQGG